MQALFMTAANPKSSSAAFWEHGAMGAVASGLPRVGQRPLHLYGVSSRQPVPQQYRQGLCKCDAPLTCYVFLPGDTPSEQGSEGR